MRRLGRGVDGLGRASLVRRLVGLAAAWSLMVLLVAGVALSTLFGRAAIERFDDELAITIDGLVAGVSVEDGQVQAPLSVDPRTSRVYSGAYWQIAAPNGPGLRALSRSRSLWDRALPAPGQGPAFLAAHSGKVVFYDTNGPLNQRLRVAAMQGRLPEMSQPIVFMAAEDRSPVDREARGFDTTLIVALLLLGAGLIAAVIVQVRVGLSPLFAMRKELADLRTGKADRVVGDYPVELAPLASELNDLMAHNQEVLERQRTHVGNLAHALKTPLSVLIAEASQKQGPLAEVVRRQASAMVRNVDHHLRRARAAARAQGQGENTLVAPVLDDLARTLRKIFGQKGIHIECQSPADLAFQGERQDLLEIAGNVMENACQWCSQKVSVIARPDQERTWHLIVEDDGPGIPAEQRQDIVRRGVRLDETAPGSGLGLAIVDDLVRAYGGGVALNSSKLGGLNVRIFLPRAERAPPCLEDPHSPQAAHPLPAAQRPLSPL